MQPTVQNCLHPSHAPYRHSKFSLNRKVYVDSSILLLLFFVVTIFCEFCRQRSARKNKADPTAGTNCAIVFQADTSIFLKSSNFCLFFCTPSRGVVKRMCHLKSTIIAAEEDSLQRFLVYANLYNTVQRTNIVQKKNNSKLWVLYSSAVYKKLMWRRTDHHWNWHMNTGQNKGVLHVKLTLLENVRSFYWEDLRMKVCSFR